MDPTLVLILGVLWFIVNVVSGLKKKDQPPRAPRREPLERGQSLPDATQTEGSRLERILRQVERTLEEAEAGPTRPEPQLPQRYEQVLYDDEDVEERQSLESEPEVVSLEEVVHRPRRQEYTQDEGAQQLVEKRISAAALRDTARTRADHIAFDREIRQEPAEHTGTVGYTSKQLRDAVVWREILGPPVSDRWEVGGGKEE
jgi:hypothetical protein